MALPPGRCGRLGPLRDAAADRWPEGAHGFWWDPERRKSANVQTTRENLREHAFGVFGVGAVADVSQDPAGDGSIVVLRRIGKRDRLPVGRDGWDMTRRQANAVSPRAMAFGAGSGLSCGLRSVDSAGASRHAPCRHSRAAGLQSIASIGETPALRGLPWEGAAPRAWIAALTVASLSPPSPFCI